MSVRVNLARVIRASGGGVRVASVEWALARGGRIGKLSGRRGENEGAPVRVSSLGQRGAGLRRGMGE